MYTELFQWIEHRTEGDRQVRLRLDRSPWNGQKLLRRGSKHLAWALLALWTDFTLVGYFIPIRELAQAVPHQLGPWESFWIGFFGLATYGNAGFLRESVCQHMCPYGHFQGSLMDASTLYVAYDERRGEPRAPRPRAPAAATRCSAAAAPMWTAPSACRCARWASTSARACRRPASAVACASTPATR
ncbi:MAG: hypothetical protein K0M67_20155 [Thiobacillus sp.]|nr:hypothetical protein [Thiobacillus sp.]